MRYSELQPRAVGWRKYYRIIPSRLPTVDYLEKYVAPEKRAAAFEVEALTNERLRKQHLPNRVNGANASVVMAAFTHIGKTSRFSDGSFGVYYAANSIAAAIKETVFHRERYLRFTDAPPRVLEMRCYTGYISQAMIDLRNDNNVHNPDIEHYPYTQKIGAQLRGENANGLLYRSVRHAGAECIAAFKPSAVTLPLQTGHYQYHWNGERIDRVMKMEQLDIV